MVVVCVASSLTSSSEADGSLKERNIKRPLLVNVVHLNELQSCAALPQKAAADDDDLLLLAFV